MKLYVVGIGMGNPKLLTMQAKEIIDTSGCLIGAQRMLDCFPDSRAQKIAAATPEKMMLAIGSCQADSASVLVSGDCGFYSAATGLSKRMQNGQAVYIPGISSLQYFCARLSMAWDDVTVISLHGREENLISAVLRNPKTFVLTGGTQSVRQICTQMCEYGLGACLIHAGERLSYPEERIVTDSAEVLSGQDFDSLAVMLIENPHAAGRFPVTHGLRDEQFLRGEVPMTKSEVRAVSISKLCIRQGQTVWDVGAGTGSVCVEIARILPDGTVYAVEKEEEALTLLERNRRKFGVSNLTIIEGIAPDVLKNLPDPDAVFVGGSSGRIASILDCAVQKNPHVRVVANAIMLETVSAVLDSFNRLGLHDQEVVQLSVAKSKAVGKNHMMLGQNPVYILSAGGNCHDET